MTQATRPRRPPGKIYNLQKRQKLCDPFNRLFEVPSEFQVPSEHNLLERCRPRISVDPLIKPTPKRELFKRHRSCDLVDRQIENILCGGLLKLL